MAQVLDLDLDLNIQGIWPIKCSGLFWHLPKPYVNSFVNIITTGNEKFLLITVKYKVMKLCEFENVHSNFEAGKIFIKLHKAGAWEVEFIDDFKRIS